MGGATSKLAENVWEKADGKISDPNDTIDGNPPTKKYEVYLITKRGVNQRDFDITDSESNLIYSTKQVPGTIACFDLMGKEMDNYLVRVNVDLARRYWTLYRFEQATFEGQKPDKYATERLVAERLEEAEKNPNIEQFSTPFLFRKALIIVSWSRYMAVSVHCGPPTFELVKRWEDQKFEALHLKQAESSEVTASHNTGDALIVNAPDDGNEIENGIATEKDENDENNNNPNEFKCSPVSSPARVKKALTTQMSDVTLEDDQMDAVEFESVNGGPADSQGMCVTDEMSDVALSTGKGSADGGGSLAVSKSAPDLKTTSIEVESEDLGEMGDMIGDLPAGTAASVESAPATAQEKTESEKRRRPIRDWAKQKSKHFRERSKAALTQSGVINDPVARNPREGVIDLNKPILLCQEIYNRIIGNHQTSLLDRKKAIELLKQDIAQHQKDDPEGAKDDEENAIMVGQEVMLSRTRSEDSGGGEPESKDMDPEEDGYKPQQTEILEEEQVPDVAEEEQPLVGYWLWENTLRTHKMKMHVAKGSDLALHVILAVIVNQVRYERNALALTV